MDERFYYQTRLLQEEIDYLSGELAVIPAPAMFLFRHARNFYWTITRLAGLGHLHGRSRLFALPRGAFDIPIPNGISRETPRIFFDLTSTFPSRFRTGIQRVMRELCRVAVEERLACPVVVHDGRFVTLPDKQPLDFAAGDRLLLLDSSWPQTDEVIPAIRRAKAQGAIIVLGLHDMIPLTMPGFTRPEFTKQFRTWLESILPIASATLAVSESSARDLCDWLAAAGVETEAGAQIGWFPLGADFQPEDHKATRSAPTTPFPDMPYFLTVGTLEPRKGHAIALDAFEKLWSQGAAAAYVIAGRQGWNVAALRARIAKSPEYGRRLLWIEGPSDQELGRLYAGARALVLPTMAEGFGLPLVEAAHRGLPAIVSDLAVFREIAGDQAVYFPPGDSDALAARVSDALREALCPSQIGYTGWRDSARMLFDMVSRDAYQATIASWKR